MTFGSLEEALAAVKHERKKWGFSMQPGASEDEIARLRQDSRAQFGTVPPERYLDLLRITNGLWENGLHVYGSRVSDLLPPSNAAVNSFLNATRMYRRDFHGFEDLLAFAEDDGYVYGMDMRLGKCVKQAYAEQTPSRTYDTFDEMLVEAIVHTLGA